MKNDSVSPVLIHFLQKLNIQVTRQSVREELEKHPDTGSLFALSDVLDKWKIPNAAYRLKFEQLDDIPTPFIVLFSGNEFAVVTSFNESHVTISNSKWNDKKFTKSEFEKLYSGVVLVAEGDLSSGESDYKNKRRKEIIDTIRLPIVLAGFFIIFCYVLFQTPVGYFDTVNLTTASLTVLKIVGLSTSILLLIQGIDADNPFLQKLCGGDSSKDCNSILSSKAAKITNELSWSEIGFFYYAGTFLTLMFSGQNPALLQILAILNLFALPYTFYSIYYQSRIAKQWCLLCCTIQGLLWLEGLFLFHSLLQPWQTISLKQWGILLINMAIPVLLWVLIKPYLLQLSQITSLKQQLFKFKFNNELFSKLLNEEPKYELPADKDSLIIGNPDAEHVITMVSNPYCQPCAKAHKALDSWMGDRDNVKLQVIFSTQNNENDRKTEVAAHLMSLQTTQNATLLKNALNDWYKQKQKSYDSWAKIYPKPIGAGYNALDKQMEWCEMTNIVGTPTLFVNGRKLPKYYQPEDIKYFV
jgi:uncharacterized membrane protein